MSFFNIRKFLSSGPRILLCERNWEVGSEGIACRKGNLRVMKRNGFTLVEIMVAMAIAVLMLVALLSLETKSTTLAARSSVGFETLPIAIERVEDLAEIDFSGEAREIKGNYEIVTRSGETNAGIPLTRIRVEVLYNGAPYSELSLYKFRF